MAGRSCDPPPDPAHEVPVAERAEGLEVPGDRGAADNRLPEVEVREAGSERGVAPGAPVALPIEDGRPGLIRDVCIPDRQRCLYSVLSGHAEWILIPDDKLFDRGVTESRTARPRGTVTPAIQGEGEDPGRLWGSPVVLQHMTDN